MEFPDAVPEKLNKGAELEQRLPGSESERVEHSENAGDIQAYTTVMSGK